MGWSGGEGVSRVEWVGILTLFSPWLGLLGFNASATARVISRR